MNENEPLHKQKLLKKEKMEDIDNFGHHADPVPVYGGASNESYKKLFVLILIIAVAYYLGSIHLIEDKFGISFGKSKSETYRRLRRVK